MPRLDKAPPWSRQSVTKTRLLNLIHAGLDMLSTEGGGLVKDVEL